LIIMQWRNDAGLAGKSVVVTGAAGGIGSAVARGFAEAGSKVLLVDIPSSPLADVLKTLTGSGHQILPCDLADLKGHVNIFDKAAEAAEVVALAHCAAVLRRRGTLDEVTEEDWDLQIDVNMKATFFLNRTAHAHFKKNGTKGSIVNFSSQGWWTGGFGGSVVYAGSKGGVVTMTKGLARSFAPDGVRVNAVSPGGVDTSMMTGNQTAEQLASFLTMIPMGRLAAPEELVGPVIFLASQAGTVANVSGGQLMY
jgi:NAD(P)-dependent dehydrogenase (short-subunit alcohol dehydrogenase family)